MGWSLIGKARRTCSHVLSSIICSKETPNHVGFIMDGNRRYAQSLGIDTMGGHSQGYRVLLDCLQWCLELQVSVVSVYAFSIDNYNRSEEEVSSLMHLAYGKLLELCREAESLEGRGVRIQIVGDVSLAPKEVQEATRQIMDATRHNSRCTLNICFSYTSSEEIVRAARLCCSGLATEQMTLGFMSHIDDYLYTADCPPMDLLIRTSGECRLSDFMLRQAHCCLLHFTPKLWPDFSYLDLLEAIILYQKHVDELKYARVSLQEAKHRSLIHRGHACLAKFDSLARSKTDEYHSPSSVITPEDTSSVDSPR
jgi:ditrans,polycis-polyprenyl diphosphate synthase